MSKIFSLKNLLTIIIALFLFSFSLTIVEASTGLKDATDGLKQTATAGFGNDVVNSPSISSVIGKIIGVVLSFVGVIFLILIIYAGFTWMLARGNDADVKKAKDLMYDAVVGLIIILAAYAITAFVGNTLAK